MDITKKRHKDHFRKIKYKGHYKTKNNNYLKLLLILSLIVNNIEYNYYNKKAYISVKKKEPLLKIYIMAHKDFECYRHNPVYTIVGDDKSHFKNKYELNIIFANQGKLFNLKRSYSEMAQLYYVYELYKKGTLSSKYIGLNHYRRYFDFADNIPDIEEIFKNYDAIIFHSGWTIEGLRGHYCKNHICEKFDEVIDIIKTIKPEYYKSALNTINNEKNVFFCNMFIMKKEDFFKYCEFMFDVLFELDRRNNFKTDEDVLNYVKKIFNESSEINFQSRLEAYLSERIANIFYYYHFKRIKMFNAVNYAPYVEPKNETFIEGTVIEEKRIYKESKIFFISLWVNIIILLFLIFKVMKFKH